MCSERFEQLSLVLPWVFCLTLPLFQRQLLGVLAISTIWVCAFREVSLEFREVFLEKFLGEKCLTKRAGVDARDEELDRNHEDFEEDLRTPDTRKHRGLWGELAGPLADAWEQVARR